MLILINATSEQKRIAMLGYVHIIPIYTSQRRIYIWAVFVQATKQPQDNIQKYQFLAATGGSKTYTILYVLHTRPPSRFAFASNVNCITITTDQVLEQTASHTSDTSQTFSYFVNYVP